MFYSNADLEIKQANSVLHYRDRWDKANIMLQYHLCGCYLQQIIVPKNILSSDKISFNAACW